MEYRDQRADLERNFRVLRNLPADIWVTSPARPWGWYRKFVAGETAKNPTDPFIAPEGYGAYIASAESEFRRGACSSSNAATPLGYSTRRMRLWLA